MPLLKSVEIGKKLVIKNNIFLAPMAGITDIAFRAVVKEFGVGLLFTEMVSSYAVIYKNKETDRICEIIETERPIGIQLFGSDSDVMRKAAEIIGKKYKPDIIDINAGCPVPKVMKSGSGAKLIESPEKLYKIIRSIVDIVDIPITVKMRLGINRKRINVVENSLAAQEAGAKLVTLHPRTADSRFDSPCLWEYIGIIKEKLSIPVCGNGDIKDHKDAISMVEDTKCDAIMIGRAVIGNPWIVRDIIYAMSVYPKNYDAHIASIREKIDIAFKHLKLSCETKGEHRGIRELRRILPHYIKGIKDSAKLRDKLVKANSYSEVSAALRSVLEAEKTKDIKKWG